MCADADAAPVDPFLHPRQGTGTSRPSGGSRGDVVIEILDEGQATPSLLTAAVAVPVVTCVRSFMAAEAMEVATGGHARAHEAPQTVSSRVVEVPVSGGHRRQRSANAPASEDLSTSEVVAASTFRQKRPHIARQKSRSAFSSSGFSGCTARATVGVPSKRRLSEDGTLSEMAVCRDNNRMEEGDDDDDDIEGEWEERATAAAASSLMASRGSPTADASTSAAAHPWLVTAAFHVCLWHVFQYAGRAMSAEDLWACRVVVSLAMPDTAGDKDSGDKRPSRGTSPGMEGTRRTVDLLDAGPSLGVVTQSEGCGWAGNEESELLLRLLLRKPRSFTAQHLDSRYGDWLHVRPALSALTQRCFLWWTAKQSAANSAADNAGTERLSVFEEDVLADVTDTVLQSSGEVLCTEMAPSPMLEHYDGARVARLLLSPCDEDMSAHHDPDALDGAASGWSSRSTMGCVVQAVRATELRTFLTRLRQYSKARLAVCESTQEGKGYMNTCAATPSAASTLASSAKLMSEGGRADEGIATKPPSSLLSKCDSGRSDVFSERLEEMIDHGVHDTIPRTKRGMILYFMERRYSVLGPSCNVSDSPGAATTIHVAATGTTAISHSAPPICPHALFSAQRTTTYATQSAIRRSSTPSTADLSRYRWCFSSVAEEADAVTQCWDHVIGSVYVPHAGLKEHLARVAEIFHVMTSNSGTGMVSREGAGAVAATMAVARPPTLLMVRAQLLLLLQTLRASYCRAQLGLVKSSPSFASPLALKSFVMGFPHAPLTRRCTSQPLPTLAPKAVSRGCDHPSGGISPEGEVDCNVRGRPFLGVSMGRSDVSASPVDGVALSAGSLQAVDTAEDGATTQGCAAPLPVCLFSTPAILEEYRRALRTHRELYDVTDGAATAAQRHRGRSSSFVSRMYDTVMASVRAGVAAVKRHPRQGQSAIWASCISGEAMDWGLTRSPASSGVRVKAPFPQVSTPLSTAFLESFFYRYGCYAEHFLVFMPLYRWFACLELIFPLLQSARRYADANACLHHLLYDPVFVLHHIPDGGARCPVSPITHEFRYRPHKRGKWLARLAQNLLHQRRNAEALAVLEEAQSGYRELANDVTGGMHRVHEPSLNSADNLINDRRLPCDALTNSTAAALCDVLAGNCTPAIESALPPTVQRRGRMLRILWPNAVSLSSAASGEGDSLQEGERSSHCSLALLHASWEYVRDRYCSRQDRLTLEKLLVTVHRKVHPWTPLPAYRGLSTSCMVKVMHLHVGGVRDARDRTLWREPSTQSHGRSAPSVGRAGGGTMPTGTSSAHNAQRHPALPVERFVLQHFLRLWCSVSVRRTRATTAVALEKLGHREALTTDLAKDLYETSDVADGASSTPVWRGAHCEGQWIACLARAFLWDCYWLFSSGCSPLDGTPLSPREGELHPLPQPVHPSDGFLWLSAFQDGPLDLSTPIQFRWRRRALIECRLAQFERSTREELIAYVSARITMDRNTDEGPNPSVAKAQGQEVEAVRPSAKGLTDRLLDEDHCTGDRGSEEQVDSGLHPNRGGGGGSQGHRYPAKLEGGSCVDHAEELGIRMCSCAAAEPVTLVKSVTLLSPPGPVGEKGEEDGAETEKADLKERKTPLPILCAETPSIPEAWKVFVGSLPLLDILRAVPLEPLWRLLRCLYLSQDTEGVPLSFSGFPDLVFWRVGGNSSGTVQTPARQPSGIVPSSFCLMEVKSPSDFSSMSQTAVSDLLYRCGFEVYVVRVNEVHDDGQCVITKRIR